VEIVSEEKKPTLKELFKGSTLDGYIEAAKTKPISTWFPPEVEGVERIEIGKREVDTIDVPSVFGSDFVKKYQNEYQLNMIHTPSEAEASILKRKGPHRHLPTAYRVWILKGLTQWRRDVNSIGAAIDAIIKFNWTEVKATPSRERVQSILNFIVETQLMYGWVGKEDVYSKFEKLAYSREEIEKILNQLIREGTIYEPREGYVRKT
jgi:hypothetical protein